MPPVGGHAWRSQPTTDVFQTLIIRDLDTCGTIYAVASSVASTFRARILLVDDEPLVLRAYAAMLASRQNDVTTAASGVEALEVLRRTCFDVIVSDIAMPSLDGIELLRKVREVDLDVPVILMTGGPSVETASLAVEQGAFRYLAKPVRLAEICEAVSRAHHLHQLALLKRQALEVMGHTDRQIGDRVSLHVRMQSAMARLVVLFQPIVSWSDRKVISFEALVRSREPTMPNAPALIGAAERLRCMPELGRAIRKQVALAAAHLAPGCGIFVNVHSAELLDGDLFDAAAPLSQFAGRVTLEVTERVSLDAVPDVRERVAALRSLGYSIALDDLGAGYAGLTSLAQLEPDLVKLDMSLTRAIDTSPTQQILVRSMASLCREMGTGFIVEGVETEGELRTLLALGVDLFQGYLFARPGPAFPAICWPGHGASVDPPRPARRET
jgi:EAL domain-containing protein (putative c-di-GMP-specific phosphodiesterase class I)